MNKVVITGVDCLTSLGNKQETWQKIKSGEHAYSLFPNKSSEDGLYRAKLASAIHNFDANAFGIGHLRIDRFVQFALVCTMEALRDSNLNLSEIDPFRVAVVMGTGVGSGNVTESQLTQLYEYNNKKVHPSYVPMATFNSLSGQIAISCLAKGPNITVSTACSSGSQAIGLAYDLIASGKADVVITGGSEAPLSPLMYAAFDNMRVMAPREEGCHPFSLERNGFVMGEGAGVLILESLEHATKRNARIYGEILGYSLTCDAYNMIMPCPTGEMVYQTMLQAARAANVNIESIGYINAHGTATKNGDKVEVDGIKKLLGDFSRNIPVSSLKGAIGHTLGASGAIEAVICLLALEHQILPPTSNFGSPDPELDLDFVPNIGRPHKFDTIFTNSFGFGGNNSCMVLHKKQH